MSAKPGALGWIVCGEGGKGAPVVDDYGNAVVCPDPVRAQALAARVNFADTDYRPVPLVRWSGPGSRGKKGGGA